MVRLVVRVYHAVAGVRHTESPPNVARSLLNDEAGQNMFSLRTLLFLQCRQSFSRVLWQCRINSASSITARQATTQMSNHTDYLVLLALAVRGQMLRGQQSRNTPLHCAGRSARCTMSI